MNGNILSNIGNLYDSIRFYVILQVYIIREYIVTAMERKRAVLCFSICVIYLTMSRQFQSTHIIGKLLELRSSSISQIKEKQ